MCPNLEKCQESVLAVAGRRVVQTLRLACLIDGPGLSLELQLELT